MSLLNVATNSFGEVLAKAGLTHDSAVWVWGKVLSVAGLIATGFLDVPYWANYLGIPATTTEVHWVQVLAVVALYLSGQYSTTSLPSKESKS